VPIGRDFDPFGEKRLVMFLTLITLMALAQDAPNPPEKEQMKFAEADKRWFPDGLEHDFGKLEKGTLGARISHREYV
jgi:hypothetical protein